MQPEIQPDGSFLKKLILIGVFFLVTPMALFSSVISLLALSEISFPNSKEAKNIFQAPEAGVRVYAALPSNVPTVTDQIISGDARGEIIKEYLKANESPLEPYANFIVETADKYQLDFRLITAIAQKESGLCRVIPEDSYNCWGWGIHSKGTLGFQSFEEGIEIVSKGLKEKYLDLGYETPDEIMKKYAHPDSTTWADGVNQFMSQME
jgi:hypothetical protein